MSAYPNLYQKSVLFEIINLKNPSEVVAAFTLTIPPEQFEVVQSQRISRTKTFGGVFQDDYGLDTAKITISGTTGNSELRASYIPGQGGAVEQYTGKDAIYVFRDKIARYKNLLVGKGLESYEMRMYDLSTMPDISALDNIQSSATDGWVVSLDDFKMSRNKDKPLWYNYSIELVGIYPLTTPRPKPGEVMDPLPLPTGPATLRALDSEINDGVPLETRYTVPILGEVSAEIQNVPVPTNSDWLQDAIGAIRRCINAVKDSYAWANNVLQSIDNVFALVDDLEDLVIEYIHASGNLLTTGIGYYSKIFEIARFPGSMAVAVMEEVNDVMQSISNAVEYTASIGETLGDDYDYVLQLCEETKRIAARMVTFGKAQSADSNINVNTSSRTVTVYGSTVTTATAATTLEQLAAQNYGDPNLSSLIAIFNGITNDDIEVGMPIKIPQIVRTPIVEDNALYSWDKDSNFGTDIHLEPGEGYVALVIDESGDFSIVSGEATLIQAINSRLNESLGKRLQLTVYGLTSGVGAANSNTAPIAYVLTNLKDTLCQDPRILDVTNIKLLGQGDRLSISCTIVTVDDVISYQGVL
jgi:hypothetical protein